MDGELVGYAEAGTAWWSSTKKDREKKHFKKSQSMVENREVDSKVRFMAFLRRACRRMG